MEPDADTISRAARLVRERREQLGLSQDMREVGGPSRWIITELELNNEWPKRGATRMKIARALQWREDAFELLEQGKDPVEEVTPVGTTDEMRSLVSAAKSILEELERRLR